MVRGDDGGLERRLQAVLAGCDERDPRYPMYATFLRELHIALRHAAGSEGAAVAGAIRRWANRGASLCLLGRLAEALAGIATEVRRGPQH